MTDLPTGTVTFLFTDVAGSTRMWDERPDLMRPALARHDALVRAAVESQDGVVFKTVGDAVCAAFQTASSALAAALAAQRALEAEPWPGATPIRVRIGLHTGHADAEGGDYFGQTLNRVARLMSAGHGGQVLLSAATWELVRNDLPADVTLRDLGERRLKDLRRPERVFQVLAPDLPADFPPLATLDARPHNLPVQLSSFVGREREMAEVKRLLGSSHLVTLTGVGGTGKTRLALQVAADLIDEFDHGVWFVDLAPLTDPDLVASTVATVLGVKEDPGREIEATLVESLKAKRLLIILDNCEHLVVACAELAHDILRAAPGVRILATSREALLIVGEATLAVPPLATPNPMSLIASPTRAGSADVVSALTQYEAVRLFIDRAVAVKPDFAVTNANAPAVAAICHRLDGIPLAIELAAARVRVLAPGQIANRLDDRLSLLTGGSRTALPRQQTLRAAIDWSHDLLDDKEKTLFRRLAVFHGGWTLEAAEGVCSGAGLADADVLDLLTRLVDKSLVVADIEDKSPRYRYLESIREYSAEQLALADETASIRDWHLVWHMRLMAQFDPSYGNPDFLAWLDWLEREHDNLRAALSWGLDDSSRVEQAVRLIRSLWALWINHGHFREGSAWYARTKRLALERGLDITRPADYAWVNYGWALLLRQIGALDQAEVCAEEARQSFERLDVRRAVSWSLNALGGIATDRGDLARAEEVHLASLDLQRDLGVAPGEMAVLVNQLGEVARGRGEFQQAAAYFRDSLAMDDDTPDTGWIHHNLGHILLRQSEANKAETNFFNGLTKAQQWANPLLMASTIGGLAGIARFRSQPYRAARLFGAGVTLLSKCGGILDATDQADWDFHLAIARAQLSASAWDSAWAEGAAMTEDEAVAYARGEIDPWADDSNGDTAAD